MSSSGSEDEMEKKKSKKEAKQKKEKATKKRSRDSSSSDEGPEDRQPVKKTKKEGGSVLSSRMTNEDGEEMIEIGSQRYVTVRSFRGKAMVDVREFYTDKSSGKLKPGKKGICLSKEQYQNFKAVMAEIDQKLSQA